MNFLNCLTPPWETRSKRKSRNRKSENKAFTLAQVLVCLVLIGIVTLLCLPRALAADQQGMPTTYTTPTNIQAFVLTATNSGTLNSWLPLRQGRGASLTVKFNVSSGTSNVVYQIAPSADGTNVDSLVWPWTLTAAGTTDVIRTTNWARGVLDGYQWLVIVGTTNQNAGTLTNKSQLFVTPNS